MFIALTNEDRARRAAEAIEAYSDDDNRSNLVDFLADAMHWCHLSGHCFDDVLDTARRHFDREITEETEERRNP